MKRAALVLGLLILFAQMQVLTLAFDWKLDLNKALEEGKEKKKPVFAYFYHPKSLGEDRKVWLSDIVQRYNTQFIAAQLNIDTSGEQIKKYDLVSFPAVIFFDPQGREMISYRFDQDKLSRAEIATLMSKVLKNIEEFSLVESQFEKSKDNPKMTLLYAKGLRDRGQFRLAEEQFNRLFSWSNLDKTILDEAKEDFAIMTLTEATKDFYRSDFSPCIERLQSFLAKCKQSDYNLQAKSLLGMAQWEAGSEKEGKRCLEEVIKEDSNGLIAEKTKKYIERKTKGKKR